MRPSAVVLAAAIAVVAGIASAVVLVRHFRGRQDPEQRRRTEIARRGRIVEGMILDIHDGLLHYTWSWRGVDYEASQDVRTLRQLLPVDESSLIGPVSVKFLPEDPSNSVVMSEDWNGFRLRG